MSKHDTIERNLMALTRRTSFKEAVKDWVVLRRVSLDGSRWQPCELCGTPCHEGAMVQHPRAKATIFVGGTCLQTLIRQRFTPRFDFEREATVLAASLTHRYGGVLDPHNWLTWVLENAPRNLQNVAAQLRVFGAAASRTDLGKLIDFHDRRRLFHRDTLLGSGAIVQRHLGMKVPLHLTIHQARRLLADRDAPLLLAQAEAERFQRDEIAPVLESVEAISEAWQGLSVEERRAVIALAKLSSELDEKTGPITPDSEMEGWPGIGEAPAFVWHARVGLGFIEGYDLMDARKANVWLWRSGNYAPSPFVLTYWKGVTGVRAATVGRVFRSAFGSKKPTWLAPGSILKRVT